jgi:hypothetical protein
MSSATCCARTAIATSSRSLGQTMLTAPRARPVSGSRIGTPVPVKGCTQEAGCSKAATRVSRLSASAVPVPLVPMAASE